MSGQFLGQVLEDRVGQAQIALGIFEIDGIDLVGHGRGADFAGLHLLLGRSPGNVAPDVPVQIDGDAVGPGEGVEQLGQRVEVWIWMV